MAQPLELTMLFAALFATQTLIFTYLLLRMRRLVRSMAGPELSAGRQHGVEEISESVLKILRELSSSGPLSAREISSRLGLSREHTARTLKKMVEDGLLIREGKPYRYKVSELGRELLRSHDVMG